MAVRVLLSVEKNIPLLELDLRGGEGGTRRETGRVRATVSELALLKLPDQLLRCGTSSPTRGQTLREELQGRGEVPHLYRSVAVAGEDEPPLPGAQPTAALALVNTERADDGPVN